MKITLTGKNEKHEMTVREYHIVDRMGGTDYDGYAYADDRGETGYTLELANGLTFTRTLTRDPHRPGLVTSVTNRCGSTVRGLAYTHDDLSRPISRNVDTFGYNERGEVVEAIIEGNTESHAYDLSGNSTFAAFNAATNFYTANNLNQYVSVSGESIATPVYTADGGIASYGPRAYAYDSASRLVSVSSNGVLLVTNAYDSRGRRVRKVTPSAVTTFVYDDWNLVRETVMYTTGVSDTFEYFWGRDLSGSFQGAGGVGGLLYVKLNGVVYIPFMDANGNITAYVDSIGTVVAEYVYDCFGRTISQSSPLADVFHHRFSSKYFDVETELYYYGYRFYSSQLRRWLNRDPIAENGGLNLYCLCNNNVLRAVDPLGRDRYMTTFSLDPRKDQWHVGVAVDTWKCSNGQWIKTGVATFDFGIDDSSFWNRLGTYFVTVGAITESEGNTLVEPMAFFSTPKQDIEMLKKIRSELTDPSLYSFFFNNCIHWANKVIDYGMDK